MNWNDVNFFITLVNQQTLTATAEVLGVQHTTVSRRIEKLEQSLNITLFERMGKRYVLSAEGQLLYTQACEIEQNIHTFKRMAVSQTKMQGNVVVSAPPILNNEYVVNFVPAFQAKYPHIHLKLQAEKRQINLFQKEADIALRLVRPTEEALVIRKLIDIPFFFYGSRAYVQRLKTTDANIQLINFDASSILETWLHQTFQCHSNADIVLTTNDLYGSRNAICHDIGLGILTSLMIKETDDLVAINPHTLEEIDCKNIQCLDANLYRLAPLYLVMHPDVRRSPRVRAVADWLIDMFTTPIETV